MRVLIQFKAMITNLKDLISEIIKVTKDIHELMIYAQIIHHSAHYC